MNRSTKKGRERPGENRPGATPDCFTCQVRDHSEWCVLSDAELKRFNDAKKARLYLPGEVVFYQGDACRGIYCFETGMVGIRKMDGDGNSVLMRLPYPGETFGYLAMLAGTEHKVSAEILKPSMICLIGRTAVMSLLNDNPALGLRFLKHASREAEDAQQKFLHSVSLGVRARLAHLLLVLKDRYATVLDDGTYSLDLPLSRQDMAAMIGVRPETISRTIRQFEAEGIAHFSKFIVRFSEIDSLLREIEPEGGV
jgi:CRP/FNR family transcriptional regulator